MANIDPYINKIKSAIYGKDVRSSICDGIKAINTQAESITSAEASRVSAEKTRVSNENTRISRENSRVSSESTRNTQESKRVTAENNRITAFNQLTDKVNKLYDEMKKAIGTGVNFNTIYPVGSIFMSISNTNPSTYFGGTWIAWAQGRVIVGVGSNGSSSYSTADAKGGHEISDHRHSATISGTASPDYTGIPSNNTTGTPSTTSTGTPSTNVSGTPSTNYTGSASGSTGATTLTTSQIPSHAHTLTPIIKSNTEATGYGLSQVAGFKDRVIVSKNTTSGTLTTAYTGSGSSHTHTLNSHTHTMSSHTHTLNSHTHSLNSHTHTMNNHTHSLSAHTHNIPQTSSVATDVRQPYITCYIWQRTA